MAGYGSFWRSTVRIGKFKALNIDHYNTETIDIGLLAVLTDVKTPSFEEIVKKLILTDAEEYVKSITDYGLMKTFWELCKKYFGYNADRTFAGRAEGRICPSALYGRYQDTGGSCSKRS